MIITDDLVEVGKKNKTKMKPNKQQQLYDLVPKGVHENRTKGVENKVDDTLKQVMFLECAQC